MGRSYFLKNKFQHNRYLKYINLLKLTTQNIKKRQKLNYAKNFISKNTLVLNSKLRLKKHKFFKKTQIFKDRRISRKQRLLKQTKRKKLLNKYSQTYKINLHKIKFLKNIKKKSSKSSLTSRNRKTYGKSYVEFIANFLK